jgi:hypothetical protein
MKEFSICNKLAKEFINSLLELLFATSRNPRSISLAVTDWYKLEIAAIMTDKRFLCLAFHNGQ